MATFTAQVDISVDEYLDKLDHNEKIELFEMLCEDLEKRVEEPKDEKYVTDYLSGLTPFEFKRILVNVLNVPNYYDDDALKTALEPIITAR